MTNLINKLAFLSKNEKKLGFGLEVHACISILAELYIEILTWIVMCRVNCTIKA